MSIRQVEQMYRKLAKGLAECEGVPRMDTSLRSEIFSKIMDDVDRLQRRLQRLSSDDARRGELYEELRRLQLVEIQVILDDYTVCKSTGKLKRWQRMYGAIEDYTREFHRLRNVTQIADYGSPDAPGIWRREDHSGRG